MRIAGRILMLIGFLMPALGYWVTAPARARMLGAEKRIDQAALARDLNIGLWFTGASVPVALLGFVIARHRRVAGGRVFETPVDGS